MELKPMTDDEGRRAEAWWALKARFAPHGPTAGLSLPSYFVPPRWNGLEGIGLGVIEKSRQLGMTPVFVGIDLAADDTGGFSPDAGATAPAIGN